jgi:predicted Zn-dependent protease
LDYFWLYISKGQNHENQIIGQFFPISSMEGRMSMVSNSKRLCILISFLIFTVESLANNDPLPDIGETSGYQLRQEKQLGQAGYEYLRHFYSFETQPLLLRYINEVGEQLLRGSGHDPRDYQFILIKDKAANALALPGGIIGINLGMVLHTANHDELAAVIAHEIAHVQLRHGMEMKKNSAKTASLRKILGAFNSSPNPFIVATLPAAITIAQKDLNNIRRNEIEADRHGINILQSSGFDSQAMSRTFGRLSRSVVIVQDSPEATLSSHPPWEERIDEVTVLLPDRNSYKIQFNSQVYEDFSKFQDSIRLGYGLDPRNPDNHYQRALVARQRGDYAIADELLRSLYSSNPENAWYAAGYAENLEDLELFNIAERVYRDWLAIFPGDPLFTGRLMALLKNTGRSDDALLEARKIERRYPDNQRIQFELVKIYRSLSINGLQLMAEANYFRLAGQRQYAINAYKKILGVAEVDRVTRERARYQMHKLANKPTGRKYRPDSYSVLMAMSFCVPTVETNQSDLHMRSIANPLRIRHFNEFGHIAKNRPNVGELPAF